MNGHDWKLAEQTGPSTSRIKSQSCDNHFNKGLVGVKTADFGYFDQQMKKTKYVKV